MSSNQNTPARFLQSTPSPSNFSHTPKEQSRLAETSQKSNSQRLDQIEEQIRSIEDQLIQVKAERERVSPGSEQHDALEDRRRQLKQELIKLDAEHLQCCELAGEQKSQYSSQKEEKATALAENPSCLESRIIESEQEYSRKLQEQLQKIQAASRARQQEIRRVFNSELNKKGNEQKQLYKNDKSETQIDRQLAQARYRSRLAELEVAIASETLRRSRQIQLEDELERLRLLDPLDWISTIDRLHPITPPYYYIDPLVLSYDPLLFPLTGSYYL